MAWAYTALFPLASAGTWLGMLLAMIIDWAALGHPHYKSEHEHQHIPYISDIGAFGLQPLFIAGCCVTVVFLDLSFLSERWLRHNHKLAPNTSRFQKRMAIGSIFFAFLGSVGLIILSIFNDYHHSHVHDAMLLVFIVGYIVSAIFICAEYQRLGIHYRNHRILRMSFWIKLSFIIIEAILAIIFAAEFSHNRNVAAPVEWAIAFIFTFYILSFILDLLPAAKHGKHIPQGVQQAIAEEKQDLEGQNQNYPGANSGDPERPKTWLQRAREGWRSSQW